MGHAVSDRLSVCPQETLQQHGTSLLASPMAALLLHSNQDQPPIRVIITAGALASCLRAMAGQGQPLGHADQSQENFALRHALRR